METFSLLNQAGRLCRRVDGIVPILRDRELAGGGHKPPLRTVATGQAVAASPQALQAALERWTESTSFKRCSPYHCELDPSPRSTIALAFSPDGQRFASTQCAAHRMASAFGKGIALCSSNDIYI